MGWHPRRTARWVRTLRWPGLLFALAMFAVIAGADSSSNGAAAPLKLPADIVYGRAASDSAVTFSHELHAGYVDNQCVTCHPQLFPMLKRGPAPNHRVMNGGGSCGTCHNGQKAFGTQDAASCSNCHHSAGGAAAGGAPAASGAAPAATGGAPAAKVPPPHSFPPGESSPGTVTFRHDTHSKGAGGCGTCHTRLFKMAPEPPRPNGGMHEPTACGACHNGTKAFNVEDSDACTRCHKESGARP